MWKLVPSILNLRLTASITFQEFLHRFWAGRGTGTSTLETKSVHQLATLREEFLYVLFLDLHKAYATLDRSRCLDILECYGVGHQAFQILRIYWICLKMVARAGRYYGAEFTGPQGVMHG